MTEQERFEEWAKNAKLNLAKMESGEYYSHTTYWARESWQAAIASREKEND